MVDDSLKNSLRKYFECFLSKINATNYLLRKYFKRYISEETPGKKIFSSMTGEHLKLQNPKKYEISLQMT